MDSSDWSLPLEEETMKKELEWLLDQEFTTFASLLQNELRECIRFITRPRQLGTMPTDTSKTTASQPPADATEVDPMDSMDDPAWIGIETTGKTVEARIAIEGWLLKDGKIGVRTPKFNKGTPFVAKINQQWKFTQLHNAHNYIVLASDQIHDIVSVQSITAPQILRSIDKIQLYLKLANDEFALNRATSPKSPQSMQVFKPSLPATLNIQFEIVATSWVTTVYVLEKPAKGAKPSTDFSTSDEQQMFSGFEVVEVLQNSKPSKKLESIANYLHSMNQLCCEFREKLIVLSSVETDGQTEAVQSIR